MNITDELSVQKLVIKAINTSSLSRSPNYLKKLEANEKLIKLRKELAQFKVDHNIQIDYNNKPNKNLCERKNNEKFNKLSFCKLKNPNITAESIHRRTWTEFQNLQIDNLKENNQKQLLLIRNNKTAQIFCNTENTKRFVNFKK